MAAKETYIGSNFECIHATVIILTSSQGSGVKEYDGTIILSIQPQKETKWLPPKKIQDLQPSWIHFSKLNK